ncbi:MAG: AraC family transcriptional regulator [Pseudomonadota bacterium]
MNETDTTRDELRTVPPPEALSPFVSVFVCRRDCVDGQVIRLLPELRSSVQVNLADPYWVREQDSDAQWRQCPRVAIWTPRTQWGYGYAKERIVVYAFGLTPLGLGALLGSDQPMMPNQIYALEYPSELRDILQAARQQRFDDWYALVSDRLTKVFRHVDPTPAVTDEALELLSIDGGGAVSSAAGLMGLSTRQFRRRFLRSFGMTPKRYQRLTRVDRMLRQLHPRAWESDAFAGEPVAFADQPHAIREFKEATGVTPSVYLASKRAGDRTLRSLAVESSVAAPVESEKDA